MDVIVTAKKVEGSITTPASKSVMQRACAAALLTGGETTIYNYGRSADDKTAIGIIENMGAVVDYLDAHSLKITASYIRGGDLLYCGESGLAARMFTPIAALWGKDFTLTGSGSLLQRPFGFFEEVLPQLGLSVESNKEKLPLKIKGKLVPADIEIDGSLSSQFLTGLLFAYSALHANDVAIRVRGLNSRPYIDLTLKVMEDFGMALPEYSDYTTFVWKGHSAKLLAAPRKFTIEGDWSNAAFLLVAGAIAGSVVVEGLDLFTTQADKKILEALQDCGCRMSIQMEQIEVSHHQLRPFHFDATACPDLFPPLVALAAACDGTSVIEGVERLIHKESDRSLTLRESFARLGIDITLQDNKMLVRGGKIRGGKLPSYNDHRIAMSASVAALIAGDAVMITQAEAVNKSYPGFYAALEQIAKGSIQIIN